MTQVNAEHIKYVTDVAEALKGHTYRKGPYGDYYITEVKFGYEGEDDQLLSLVANDAGGLDIEVTP